jgi:hypothetical protein
MDFKKATTMPNHHPITIRFIRRTRNGGAEGNPRLDDILTIYKLGENNLRVVYIEQTEDGIMRDMALMTYQKLSHYLMRIFWMLTIDDDPFQSVQFYIPGYPQTLIKVATVQTNLPILMDIILNTCWHWPVVARPSAADTTATEGPPLHPVPQ